MYGKIRTIKKYEILVKNEQNILYKGMVEDAPEEIREMNYKQVKFNESVLEVNV